MSPVNKIDIVLTQQQIDGIQEGIDLIKENLPVQVNLTIKERTDLPNIADERYPYVQRAIEQHAPANPQIAAGAFYGPLPEAQNDFTFFDQMQPFIGQLAQLAEIYEDTQHLAGSEAWAWFRSFYGSAQNAAENSVPGSDAVVNDLKGIFEEQGGPGDGDDPTIP